MKNDKRIIFFAGFLFSIPIALTSYINSSFLENYTSKYFVGVFYIIASIISIIGFFKIPKLLNKLGNRHLILLLSLLSFFSLLTLAFSKTSIFVIPAFIIFFVTGNFIIASLDIFIEDFSKGASIGKLRGLYLMFINLAWVIAQLVSGSIIEKSSFKGIYLFSAGFMILFSLIFVFYLHNFKDPKYIKASIVRNIKFFIKNKNISRIYFINLVLKVFFAWMVIYTPIYLHEYMHFNWTETGTIFTIMLIPFVILDYPLGELSDKIGEKKMLIIGFLITAVFTLSIPLISQPKVWIWALILFGTRVGAATIEVLSESYFFKEVDEKNADAISFFRNTYPLSYIVAPILAMSILFFVPSFKYLFFILGAIMLYGLFITLKLEDIK